MTFGTTLVNLRPINKHQAVKLVDVRVFRSYSLRSGEGGLAQSILWLGYDLDNQAIVVRFSAVAKHLSPPEGPEQHWTPASHLNGLRGFYLQD